MRKKRGVKRKGDISERHIKRQKKRRRLTVFGRIVFFLLFVTAAAVIVTFFTPVFNMREITVEGNAKVDTQTIIAKMGVTEGENLFKINLSQLEKSLETIAYIDEINVKRVLFPPSLNISVTESEPKACVSIGGNYVLIDKKCKVLEECGGKAEKLPEIVGLNLQKYSIGSKLDIDESEKSDIIVLCIDKIDELGLIADVDSISVDDTNRITFKYQNRLTVICGSELELEYKLAYFGSIVQNRLEENARGTIDLSTKGKAVYTP